LRRDRFFQLGLVLVAAVLAAALLAPWLAPFDPLAGDLRNAYLQGPGGRSSSVPTPRGGMC
jgi:ABC-type dipeptide/oligopeptide/nickel transport system permease subunit